MKLNSRDAGNDMRMPIPFGSANGGILANLKNYTSIFSISSIMSIITIIIFGPLSVRPFVRASGCAFCMAGS